MKTRIYRFIALTVAVLTAFFNIYVPASAGETTLKDVKFSVLGDSISTFKNISNGNGADTTNSTIRDYTAHYAKGKYGMTVSDTWWQKTMDLTGMKAVVNNSCSGSMVFYPSSKNQTLGYINRCVNLHDNTGENAGEKPDIIAVYLGTNDFTNCKGTLGSADDINYSQLYKKSSGVYTYKEPKSTCEAYAIMLNKIKVAYPNAEVYCFTVLPRTGLTEKETATLESFNESIAAIADHYNFYTVDIYNDSGIKSNKSNINRYIGDGYLHPAKLGMQAISNAFLSSLYKNSKYLPSYETVYNVKYTLNDNVIVNEGTKTATLGQEGFSCTLSKLSYGKLNVTVKMGSEDITETAYKNNKINIPNVTGDIEITAYTDSVERAFDSYRWETTAANSENSQFGQEDTQELQNIVNSENKSNNITPLSGGINDGFIQGGEYILEDDIELFYDKPWDIIWSTEYSENATPLVFSSTESSTEEGTQLIHIQENTSVLAMAVYRNGNYHNLGIDLAKYNINYKEAHTYKLSNAYNSDGTNTVTLFVDGVKVGNLNKYYINGEYQGTKKDALVETDFLLSYIGTADKPVDGCKLNYIQVWENSTPEKHTHNFAHLSIAQPNCEEPGAIRHICDCGNMQEQITENALGHIALDWQISTTANVNRPGLMVKKCSRCGETVQKKNIAQKKCATPALGNIKNAETGVYFSWKKTDGADSYKIYRKEAGKNWVYLTAVPGSYNSYTDKKASSGKKYYYTVKAVNEAGASGHKSGLLIKYLAAPKLKKASNTSKGITVSWSKSAGTSYYNLYRKTGNGKWTFIKKTTSLSYTDTKVYRGKTYSYTVKAVGKDTTSAHSIKGISLKRLSAPALKSVSSGKSGVTLKWSKSPYCDGYIVYRKSGNGSYSRITTIKNGDKLAYLDKTAKKGVTYTYTVKAYSGSSYSAYNSKGIKIKDKY